MVKCWKYIQSVVTMILILGLGWLIVNNMFFKEGPISSLELALRMAKGNRTELEKVLYY